MQLRAILQSPTGPWLWLLTPLFLAAAPHFFRMPFWIGPVCVGLWLLRLAAVDRPRLVPPRFVRLTLTVISITGVYASYGYLLGPEPGTALLLLLLALKPLETRGYRDQLVMILLTYLVVLLHFLVSQSLPAAGYMALVVLLNTASMLGLVHQLSRADIGFRLRHAGTLLLQAAPVMLILFVLFPRLPGSLWGLFQKPEAALTGLSDTMNPGDVSRLLQSSEVAFRVTFETQTPQPSRMYWRALVLWETDGRSWHVGQSEFEPAHADIVPAGPLTRYLLTLEAHGQNWLPALEMPVETPVNTRSIAGLHLKLDTPLRQRAQFSMASALEFSVSGLNREDRLRALALPETANPRSRSMAEAWRTQYPEDRTVVDAALNLFRGPSFVYTLAPPLLGQEAVDDFLFRTRSGYCEHYASAFTFLMRAAGIPSRVVLGYQGGQFNPLGDYYVVRQYHAHAWSEVWIEEEGWVRIDPTSVLAPDRIEIGADALVPNIGIPGILTNREIGWAIGLWRNLTMGWDAANALWNQWVLDFGVERQRRFFERLGLGGASRLERFGYMFLALAGCCLAAGLFYGMVLLRSRKRPHRADRLYADFCKRMTRIGMVRRANEGPLDFARRASTRRPDLSGPIEAVSQSYIRIRYGSAPEDELTILARLVGAFHPQQVPGQCSFARRANQP